MDKYGVVDYVSLKTGIDKDSMFLKTRQGEVANARHAVRWILFNKVGVSIKEIAEITKCDRTTVYNSIDVVNDLVDLPFDYAFDYVNGFGVTPTEEELKPLNERYSEALEYICSTERCTKADLMKSGKQKYSKQKQMLIWILVKRCGIPLDFCKDALVYDSYQGVYHLYNRACRDIDNNARYSRLHRYKPSVNYKVKEEDYHILDTSL